MSTDEPYLIAHKVRGEAAFDIAIKAPCPNCSTHDEVANEWVNPQGCDECEHSGCHWIVATSGHRAYPYWNQSLNEIWLRTDLADGHHYYLSVLDQSKRFDLTSINVPDHYRINPSPKESKSFGRSLLTQLGLGKKVEPIKRRV